MKHLFADWKRVEGRLVRKRFFLFLDYDGTLAPIADSPSKALIPKETKTILYNLSKHRHCKVAIISGRSLKDIEKTVGLDNIIYAGNHGLELEGPCIRSKTLVSPRLLSIIRRVNHDLTHALSEMKGVVVENKGLTLSIHYRLISDKRHLLLRKIITRVIKPYVIQNQIKIVSGKKVYEVRPSIKWNKGKIVSWLLTSHGALHNRRKVIPVYIGDDVTDEDVFRFLKNKGITIHVGSGMQSTASYYLRNPSEVSAFLRKLSTLHAPDNFGRHTGNRTD